MAATGCTPCRNPFSYSFITLLMPSADAMLVISRMSWRCWWNMWMPGSRSSLRHPQFQEWWFPTLTHHCLLHFSWGKLLASKCLELHGLGVSAVHVPHGGRNHWFRVECQPDWCLFCVTLLLPLFLALIDHSLAYPHSFSWNQALLQAGKVIVSNFFIIFLLLFEVLVL